MKVKGQKFLYFWNAFIWFPIWSKCINIQKIIIKAVFYHWNWTFMIWPNLMLSALLRKSIKDMKIMWSNERKGPLGNTKLYSVSLYLFWFWRRRFLKKKKDFCLFSGLGLLALCPTQTILWYLLRTIQSIIHAKNQLIWSIISCNFLSF